MGSINREFIALCHQYSDAVDLIQAGGGNASTKYLLENESTKKMMIKASGFLMSEVDDKSGFSIIDLDKILAIVDGVQKNIISIDDESLQNQMVNEANLSKLRPSIETYLHALLPFKHVLHLHSFAALRYTSTEDYSKRVTHQFDKPNTYDHDFLCVGYEKPGMKLALELQEKLNMYKAVYHKTPQIILLKNHGIIIAADDLEQVEQLYTKSEDYLLKQMVLPVETSSSYRQIIDIKRAFASSFDNLQVFVRLNEDRDLVRFKRLRLSFPDAVVFCGPEAIYSENYDQLIDHIEAYKIKYNDFPKIIVYQKNLYFVATTIKKCLEIQDVLKIQFLLDEQLGEKLNLLESAQIYELLNWEAEKYRKKL